jgi:hypothetical protein
VLDTGEPADPGGFVSSEPSGVWTTATLCSPRAGARSASSRSSRLRTMTTEPSGAWKVGDTFFCAPNLSAAASRNADAGHWTGRCREDDRNVGGRRACGRFRPVRHRACSFRESARPSGADNAARSGWCPPWDDGVAGRRAWGLRLAITQYWNSSSQYGTAPICAGPMHGAAYFFGEYQGKLLGLSFVAGARTDRNVGIGSTLSQSKRVYGKQLRRGDDPDLVSPTYFVLAGAPPPRTMIQFFLELPPPRRQAPLRVWRIALKWRSERLASVASVSC